MIQTDVNCFTKNTSNPTSAISVLSNWQIAFAKKS